MPKHELGGCREPHVADGTFIIYFQDTFELPDSGLS